MSDDERQARLLRKIREQQHFIEALELELTEKQRECRGIKSQQKAAQAQLRRLIDGQAEDQLELPLTDEDAEESDDEPSPWRHVPVAELIVASDKQFDRLKAAGIETLGELLDYRDGNFGLHGIPGIARSVSDRWEKQVDEWISANVGGVA
jgi:hypothetical protein